jgi:hypothetical protein
MFRPKPREAFMAEATTSSVTTRRAHRSRLLVVCRVQASDVPGRTCDVLGDGEQYEWYVNLLLQDVDGALEIVAEASHLAWMDLEDFLRRGDHAGQGRQALRATGPSLDSVHSRNRRIPVRVISEYALKDYTSRKCKGPFRSWRANTPHGSSPCGLGQAENGQS